jgi:hypothetical protein
MYSYVLLCTPMYSRNVEHLSTEMECTHMYSRVQRTYSYVLQILHSKYSDCTPSTPEYVRWTLEYYDGILYFLHTQVAPPMVP